MQLEYNRASFTGFTDCALSTIPYLVFTHARHCGVQRNMIPPWFHIGLILLGWWGWLWWKIKQHWKITLSVWWLATTRFTGQTTEYLKKVSWEIQGLRFCARMHFGELARYLKNLLEFIRHLKRIARWSRGDWREHLWGEIQVLSYT